MADRHARVRRPRNERRSVPVQSPQPAPADAVPQVSDWMPSVAHDIRDVATHLPGVPLHRTIALPALSFHAPEPEATQPAVQRSDAGGAAGATSSVQTRTRIERYPFRATIRRAAPALGFADPSAVPVRRDAGPGQEHGGEQYLALFEQLSANPAAAPAIAPETAGGATPEAVSSSTATTSTSSTATTVGTSTSSTATTVGTAGLQAGASPAEETATPRAAGSPIAVPDIEIPALAQIEKTDAVNGAFTYSGSITRGGAAPSGFGVTRSFSSRLTGVTITPNAGTFDVSATFEHPITYQVRSGTGPSGQVDIASDSDPDITAANYATVAADLTPNMSDLNGRPPRTQFWAEDLTLRHELVHANDDLANGPGAMATVTTWLNGQTAASAADVQTLLNALPGRFATALLAALSTEDGERHAYGDGAPVYRARAEAISARGGRGEYT